MIQNTLFHIIVEDIISNNGKKKMRFVIDLFILLLEFQIADLQTDAFDTLTHFIVKII